ncbi:ABC transporter permease [Vibrio zhanjiangensis]|uniref:ABC transporter permease n=1 Tax=Vibrio zhanjiangensis TaxID=1046128 RepID=UPI0024E059E8|nr:ABC transporter permease [Vibrio zhanjiangensis]
MLVSNVRLLAHSLLKNKNLIYQLCKRDILSRYRGTAIGLAWSVFIPILMLALYTFVFSFVFKARWGDATDLPKEIYALVLYTGMIVHALFTECLSRSATLMHSNISYVKKVVFPLDTLSWVVFLSSLFQAFIGIFLLLLANLFITGNLFLTILFIPIVLIPLFLIIMGISWFISSVGVYFRDVSHLTGVCSTVLMFASPIFYPVTMLPENIRPFIYLNPLTYFIEETRNIILWGEFPAPENLIVSYIIAVPIAVFGFSFFQRTRRGFADVL